MNHCKLHPDRPRFGETGLCHPCLLRYRELCRANYRRKRGIPLDAPLRCQGRTREEVRLSLPVS